MMAFSESELARYSSKEIMKYGIFDEYGVLNGVKEDAPAEFKVAYETDKKLREKWESMGID